ncbi:hypothetical protein PybrP1_007731 [[Pythium] brassicae (nom. inval.)]|nr:hypothetical protein PybrP1_007731 [[Pythium] brassicae (nom. inval.)]
MLSSQLKMQQQLHRHQLRREIARVTVTSDSEELLDGLEVVPLDLGRLAKGLRVRVKNEAAELKGSLMAQVYVNSKNTVRTLDASMAACVVGEDVLVHDAPTETLSLIAHNSSDLFVSSDQGFSLDALTVAIDSHATIQLSAPSIVARNGIGVTSWWNGGSALVATEAIVAKEVNALAIVSGDVVLQTARLMAEKCFTAAAISGSSRIVGEGIVMEQMAMAFWSSVASSPGVIARKVEAFVGLTGAAIVHAAMHLEAYRVGAATVEYVGEEPELVKSDSWLSWLDTKRSAAEPFVRPASQSAIAGASESRQLRELPVREPVPFHVRVKKAKIPELQNLEGSSYRAKQLADIIPTVGILAVGALGILSFRRRRLARLAKQAA